MRLIWLRLEDELTPILSQAKASPKMLDILTRLQLGAVY